MELKRATVISKRRGDEPEIHYLIGPQRESRQEAERDLETWEEKGRPEMKLSEFMRKMRNELDRDGYVTASIIETLLDARKRGAEAAGVVWDPEEEPLPEKVEIYLRDGWLVIGPARGPMPGEGQRAIALEAQRRFNAWPELEKLAEPLKEILRGGAR
jgi:hypothetical protein